MAQELGDIALIGLAVMGQVDLLANPLRLHVVATASASITESRGFESPPGLITD
jgi:hypothetical protein